MDSLCVQSMLSVTASNLVDISWHSAYRRLLRLPWPVEHSSVRLVPEDSQVDTGRRIKYCSRHGRVRNVPDGLRAPAIMDGQQA